MLGAPLMGFTFGEHEKPHGGPEKNSRLGDLGPGEQGDVVHLKLVFVLMVGYIFFRFYFFFCGPGCSVLS